MSRLRPYFGLFASRRGVRPYAGAALRVSRRSAIGISATGRPWVKFRLTPKRAAGRGLLWFALIGLALWWLL